MAWLLLTGLAAAAGRLLVIRRGGWLVMLSGTTVLGWCRSTDTDPWPALAHRWPLTEAATLAAMLAAAVAVPVLRGHGGAPVLRIWLRGLESPIAAVGVVVILPALTRGMPPPPPVPQTRPRARSGPLSWPRPRRWR